MGLKVEVISSKQASLSRGYWAGVQIDTATRCMKGGGLARNGGRCGWLLSAQRDPRGRPVLSPIPHPREAGLSTPDSGLLRPKDCEPRIPFLPFLAGHHFSRAIHPACVHHWVTFRHGWHRCTSTRRLASVPLGPLCLGCPRRGTATRARLPLWPLNTPQPPPNPPPAP